MIGIVISRADSASEHIGEHLLELRDWSTTTDNSRPDASGGGTVYRTDSDGFELREFDERHLQLEGVADAFDTPALDLIVFASRHSGNTGPLLTAHFTGNFGSAEHGGVDKQLARACPNAHAHVLDALATYAPAGYDVGMECTHHGPSAVGAPSMFVEVGSNETQWNDPDAARAVGKAILDLRGVSPDRPAVTDDDVASTDGTGMYRHLVGFGGGHYAPRFGRIARETDWAVGHVAADWGLDEMRKDVSADADTDTNFTPDSRSVIEQAFENSRADLALIEGEGTHSALLEEIEALGYRVVSETWIRATDGVSRPLVERLERELCPVEDGLRFGDHATDADPDVPINTASVPTELIETAEGIDRERTIELFTEATIAFETVENGNRIGDRVAFPSDGKYDYDALIDSSIDLLRTEYESVTREDDTVVAQKSVFDPSKAKTLGVPEGPKFGTLADGNSVRIDGETIDPELVQSHTVDRFPV